LELLESIVLNEEGREVKLGELIGGRWTVLYFYPKDNTPGCTLEGREFTELLEEFKKLGVQVYGVSRDSPFSHREFKRKNGILVPLLSDPDGRIHKMLGAWGKKRGGKEGTVRSTFIIDPSGKIVWSRIGVSPKGHAREVLEAVRNLLEEAK